MNKRLLGCLVAAVLGAVVVVVGVFIYASNLVSTEQGSEGATERDITLTATAGVAYVSGGLGLDRAQWEESHTPTEGEMEQMYDGGAEGGGYDVIFYNERIARIFTMFPDAPLSEADAIVRGESFMPQDKEFIEVYTPEGRPEMTVRVYFSASLAERMGADLFFNSEPGTFILQYYQYGNGVESLAVGTSNNP